MTRTRLTRLVGYVLVAVLVGAATAGAAKLITGKQIKDGSVGYVDIAKKAKKKLRGQRGAEGTKGDTGAAGAQGPTGLQGPKGDPGTDGINGAPGAAGTSGSTAPALILGNRGANAGAAAWTTPYGSNAGDENGATVVVPNGTALVARDFTVTTLPAPGVGQDVTVTLLVNGSDSALNCTVAGTATTCSAASSTTVNLNGGDRMAMRVNASAGSFAGLKAGWGFRIVF